MTKVLFVHGLMSSPQGTKAQYLAERFDALTPGMDTSDFPGCVAMQREAIRTHQPDVVIGSSFGGAVLLQLLLAGDWAGPTLLLAQAARKLDPDVALPEGVRVILVHGTADDVIPIEDSRGLAKTGSPERVELIEVEDGHRLYDLVQRDELAALVRRLAEGG